MPRSSIANARITDPKGGAYPPPVNTIIFQNASCYWQNTSGHADPEQLSNFGKRLHNPVR